MEDTFKVFVEVRVSEAINNIFAQAHEWAKTNSGDITPAQVKELDKLQEKLTRLVIEQTVQNIGVSPDENSLPEAKWTVPVCRTAYAHHTMEVTARTEEEAIEKALDAAGDIEFSEKDADYSAPNGASKL